MTVFTDDFNRANAATLGAAWIDNKGEWGGGLEIASNQAGTVSGDEDASIYGTPVSTSAAFVEVDWIDNGNGDNWRTHLLMDVDAWDDNVAGPPNNGPTTGGANSGYNIHAYVWDNVLSLQKAATTVATVNSFPGSGAQNFTMRLEHDGFGGVTVYQDGVEELSYTDAGTSPTGRYVGLAAKGAEFDNFSAGDIFHRQFSDDFNRADGARGINWAGQGRYGAEHVIDTNIFTTDGTDFGGSIWGRPTVTNAQYIEADLIAGDTAGDTQSLHLNLSGTGAWDTGGVPSNNGTAGSAYMLKSHPWFRGYLYFFKDATALGNSGSVTGVANDTDMHMRMEHDGFGNLTFFTDGVERWSYTDGAPLTGKYVGLSSKDVTTVNGFDNFLAGDRSADLVEDRFQAYADNTDIGATAKWASNTRTGSGVNRIDEHHDHHGEFVVDGSTTCWTFNIYKESPLSYPNQWGQLTVYNDRDGYTDNHGGVILRAQDPNPSNIDAYLVRLRKAGSTGGTANDTYLELCRVDSDSTTVLSSYTIAPGDIVSNYSNCAVVTGSIIGSVLTGYVNGNKLASYDTSVDGVKYQSGGYVGFSFCRGQSATNSQPFVTNFHAWIDGVV